MYKNSFQLYFKFRELKTNFITNWNMYIWYYFTSACEKQNIVLYYWNRFLFSYECWKLLLAINIFLRINCHDSVTVVKNSRIIDKFSLGFWKDKVPRMIKIEGTCLSCSHGPKCLNYYVTRISLYLFINFFWFFTLSLSVINEELLLFLKILVSTTNPILVITISYSFLFISVQDDVKRIDIVETEIK